MSGGVLAELKARVDLRAHGMKDEAGDVDPSGVKDRPWVTELEVKRYLENKSDGKWLIECDTTEVGTLWQLCRKMYHSGALSGVSSMKVSTSHERYSSWRTAVIVLYCTGNESACKETGQSILDVIPYSPPSGKMFFKTDAQTLGAEAGSHVYWLPTKREQ
eukprot:TRINITY_DN1248_c0_g5_i2.p1 TRINITY_DN1248_c0_g5~~TRINITY_DN1248_c0_g5_i2.p1  ORF type:complete len:161 (+),score=31.21 TRINITY_DN1248_c0_g5_i2:72-554(+)